MLINYIKKFASKYINKRINKGIGITTDDNIQLSIEPDIAEYNRPISKISPKYKLKTTIGYFEFIGFVKGKVNKENKSALYYKLRHINTAEELTISENIFTLFFEKDKRIKEEND